MRLLSKVCFSTWLTNQVLRKTAMKQICSGTVIDTNRQWCDVCGLVEYIPQLVRLHSKDCSWEKSLNSLALRQQSHTSDTACWRICKGEGLEMSFGFVFLKHLVTSWETDFSCKRNVLFFLQLSLQYSSISFKRVFLNKEQENEKVFTNVRTSKSEKLFLFSMQFRYVIATVTKS